MAQENVDLAKPKPKTKTQAKSKDGNDQLIADIDAFYKFHRVDPGKKPHKWVEISLIGEAR